MCRRQSEIRTEERFLEICQIQQAFVSLESTLIQDCKSSSMSNLRDKLHMKHYLLSGVRDPNIWLILYKEPLATRRFVCFSFKEFHFSSRLCTSPQKRSLQQCLWITFMRLRVFGDIAAGTLFLLPAIPITAMIYYESESPRASAVL